MQMENGPVLLWRSGPMECVVVHHWHAQSYEIHVRESGLVIDRRWFVTSEEAASFASACWRKVEDEPV
jgi:hypothetical protein